jgi:hypothetical protein
VISKIPAKAAVVGVGVGGMVRVRVRVAVKLGVAVLAAVLDGETVDVLDDVDIDVGV